MNQQRHSILKRGKEQRASISSCSSSDSYASYGSGYASGSGNSTDHDHKQRRAIASSNHADIAHENDKVATSNENVDSLKESHAGHTAGSSIKPATADPDKVDEDDDSQLKQHLSELEQLTDDLANRKLLGTLTCESSRSATIKSKSSDSSSVISTGSDISSSLSAGNDAHIATAFTSSNSMQPPAVGASDNVASRSTSTTPTASTQNMTGPETCDPACLKTKDEDNALKPQVPKNQYQHAKSAGSQPQKQQQSSITVTHSSPSKQEPYYHNLFQWEQLVSKGITRPLLINDLDFTDLRDEDDCDLLNTNSSNNQIKPRNSQNGADPLTINIPAAQQQSETTSSEDPLQLRASSNNPGTPASAPPPMPPPPMSPWFNTLAGSRPQSQLTSTPSPTSDFKTSQPLASNEFNRDQSPANSSYSNYSRNSVCLAPSGGSGAPNRESLGGVGQLQFNHLQSVTSLRSASSMSSLLFGSNGKYGSNKTKKTMKLFWKEVREERSLLAKLTKKKTIWDEIKPVPVDTGRLEYLFESKAKDLSLSKSRHGLDGLNQRKAKIIVLDAKRSNAINIGMTKLPPMRTIKSAILKMDSSIMNREGIEKILTTMMPTEEEKSRIIEAQLANPDTPLGTAEQFLLNLASISALEARLKLWAFQLDYAQIEKEVAEPLMDLKQAIEEIEKSENFRIILGTLLSIGNFLNSTNVKGFQIDYLEKVPEVKDTVHKHSLLHHLCLFIQEKYDLQGTGDLYSEFSAVNRASKVDYTEVAKNLKKMQQDCKASWDYLKIVAKHDGLANLLNTCSSSIDSTHASGNQQLKSSGKLNNLSKLSMITTITCADNAGLDHHQQPPAPTSKQLKTKVSDFLTDCAERIMVLMVIHRRVMNRFQKLLVYLGSPSHQIKQSQPQQILKIINEFALEYRTKRERVREMLLKKQQCHNHHHHHNHNNSRSSNRWNLNRSRWTGSQQCIDPLALNRPCSTTSSCCTSTYGTSLTCADSVCNISLSGMDLSPRYQSVEPSPSSHHHHHYHANKGSNNHNGGTAGNNDGNQRGSGNSAHSPSGFNQASGYCDYLYDRSSCCDSRQQSITPVPCDADSSMRRPNSISISMYDLQQGPQHGCNDSIVSDASGNDGCTHKDDQQRQQARKDDQLRRLLGAGKSLDGACNDLYQMSHWTSTMTRVTRHPPLSVNRNQRAASIDSSGNHMDLDTSSRQTSFYKNLSCNGGDRCDDDYEQNSDEEILQSLVRTAKGTHHKRNPDSSPGIGNRLNVSDDGASSAANREAKIRIMSRFNCDRKSMRRTLVNGIEVSNVG